ncbi:MAG: alpha/beta fold hydrolase [Deltaproteobacteria bacterium]|nr:alpha/beta fold hydrolase [Deltaproteobacteria bacterium]
MTLTLALISTLYAFAEDPERLPTPARVAPPRTVVFIHGLYLNAGCWDDWREVFEAQGYNTLAPEWPGHDGEPAALRADIPEALNTLSFEQLVAQHRELVAGLDSPILIGHSMGGLIVQLLLQEGLGSAGVVLHSAPPKGLTSFAPAFLRSNAPVLKPGMDPILLSPKQFHFGFANYLDRDAALALYEASLVPEAKGVAKGPLTDAAELDWAKERAPLLIVAGAEDHVIPAGLNERMARRYEASPSRTDLVVMPGRTHGTLTQPGWEQVADDVLAWLAEL